MTIYLYGLILRRSAHLVPAHITGLDASVLRVVASAEGGVGALVSTVDRTPDRRHLDDLRAHDHALQAVVHHGSTAAAVRFGQTFASEDDLRRHVAEHGHRVARLLDQYDGCVEMRLLMTRAPEGPASPRLESTGEDAGPGHAYLQRLKNAGSSERLRGLGLVEALGPVVRAERVEELPMARGIVFSHLIVRGRETEYRAAVAAMPALKDAKVVGPLALYSFSESISESISEPAQ